ncbi:hypothetical protein Afil01_24210 [Actinorhabdospora filicis]|uniref:DUF998 domain-containing protein n=1 Tax=Actinorhabdospora filicis TaxID=1785913 RepID=A0A9W6W8I8_9ACTN|nr:DUF998 domain-containing protein [Actinorhabdospora filicis]GLZ77614.1 hypothetical protein Afil01_24210 [Actinorhabdospora filicis]
MTAMIAAPAARTATSISTKVLLAAGALAGPLWLATSWTQALTREGFNPAFHPLSQLATGSLGWLQITNFLVAGLLYVLGAEGLRRMLPGRWTGRLVRLIGIGMAAAGVFVMDPGYGFPVGTPNEAPTSMSWHSAMHMVAGTFTFSIMTAALFVIGRIHAKAGRKNQAILARIAASAVIVGNVWAITQLPGASPVMAVGVGIGLLWTSVTALRIRLGR